MSKPSVCIIGRGAVGLCSALYLVRRGVRDVTVVDRAHPAAGSSGLFVGVIDLSDRALHRRLQRTRRAVRMDQDRRSGLREGHQMRR